MIAFDLKFNLMIMCYKKTLKVKSITQMISIVIFKYGSTDYYYTDIQLTRKMFSLNKKGIKSV